MPKPVMNKSAPPESLSETLAEDSALTAELQALLAQSGPGGTPSLNPWQGVGMATDANIAEFVRDMKQLQAQWPILTAAQRLQRMMEAANRQLAKSGVPTVEVDADRMASTVNGLFRRLDWQIAINRERVQQRISSDEEAANLAATLFHESRHAEQLYLAARRHTADVSAATPFYARLGASTRQVSQISRTWQMSLAAVQSARQHPLVSGSSESQMAQAMYDAFFGANKSNHDAVLKTRLLHRGLLRQAEQTARTVLKDSNATTQQRREARNALRMAVQNNTASYQDYLELPEETDARSCGDAVKSAW